jgi:hypothetical protein
MTSHKVGTREEWLAARRELLEAEKEHTRRGDQAVAAQAPVDRGARGDRSTPDLASWCSIRRGPHPGCSRRSSQTEASISGEIWWGHDLGRWEGTVGQSGQAIDDRPGRNAL